MTEISIIVPVYNTEKHLKKCVDSILAQTFKDFELILVDDGSKDSGRNICDEYIKSDSRVRVIHKENGGVSSARNAGIDLAKGRYIGFVDSDDYIDKDMYETLINDIKQYDANISICRIYGHNSKNHKLLGYSGNEKMLFNGLTAMGLVLEGKILSAGPVDKLYKAEVFNNIRYPQGKNYEDAFITPEIIFKSERIIYNPAQKYHYIQRNGSITTSKFKPLDFNIIEAYSKHLDFIQKKAPSLKKQAIYRYFWSHMMVLDKMVVSEDFNDKEKYELITKKIKRNLGEILLNPFFSWKRKLLAFSLIFGKSFYKRLVIINDHVNH